MSRAKYRRSSTPIWLASPVKNLWLANCLFRAFFLRIPTKCNIVTLRSKLATISIRQGQAPNSILARDTVPSRLKTAGWNFCVPQQPVRVTTVSSDVQRTAFANVATSKLQSRSVDGLAKLDFLLG
jgi:hypothetical protein